MEGGGYPEGSRSAPAMGILHAVVDVYQAAADSLTTVFVVGCKVVSHGR